MSKEIDDVLFIQLNAMAMKNSVELFEEIKKKIFDSKPKEKNSKKLYNVLKEQKKYEQIILMIDEFDSIFNNSNQEILDIFKYSAEPECRLILIGISNSMELVYNLGKKFNVNLSAVKNLVFKSYSFSEMIEIIQKRVIDFVQEKCINLDISDKDIIEPNALKLCANRIYNLKGGDIRCMLDVLLKVFSHQYEKIENGGNESSFVIGLNDLLKVNKFLIIKCLHIFLKVYEEIYNQKKNDEIINSLPMMHQTILLVCFQIFTKKTDCDEIEINKLLLAYNAFTTEFFLPVQDVKNLIEVLKYLESYNFILLKQSAKYKNLMIGDNLIIKLKINLDEIKNSLISNESFGKYLIN